MNQPVRVRYAPSPTGHLHIGNARTALFNYLYARHYGGQFIVRIEDTDAKRNVEGGEQNQLSYLKWLGIEWDESIDVGGNYGPYRQSERLSIYKKCWKSLLERGLAYYCYCTEEELQIEREQQISMGETPKYGGKHRNLTVEEQQAFVAEGRLPSIRFRVPDNHTYTFEDMVKGTISFQTHDMGDFVIVKKDGMPTYNFAVAVDDHFMKITHVLRGEDHISNTPRQLMIYEAQGWTPPQFGHMTLIVGNDHKKLSKRDESVVQFIQQYEEFGYIPEALFNFIALLGWSPQGEQEMYSKQQLIFCFDEKRLSKSPALFDRNKLAHINSCYIKQADPTYISSIAIPYLQKAGCLGKNLTNDEREWAHELVCLYQDKLVTVSDIVSLTTLFFEPSVQLAEEAKHVLEQSYTPSVLRSFLSAIQLIEQFNVSSIAQSIKQVQNETGFKGKQLFMPIRVALTGQTHGPDLNITIHLLGFERVIKRLNTYVNQN